jgi:hypothetical protein
MGPTDCPETSVTIYKSTLHNIAEERRCNLQNDGSLKSRSSGKYRNITAVRNDSAKYVKRVGEN